MKPLVTVILMLAMLFPAGVNVQAAETNTSDGYDELGSVVPLLLILATPEKYENQKVTFSAFVKRYEWGYVGFYNEDSAKYDLLEYGVLLQTNSANPLTNFCAAIEKNGTNECYSLFGVLQAERKERKLGQGRVLMPVVQLTGFWHSARGKGLPVIPKTKVEGTLIPAVSLLLQPEKYKQTNIITRGVLLGDPEGNVWLHATADNQRIGDDLHLLYILRGERPYVWEQLRIIYKASPDKAITVEGTIHEKHFGFPFPTVPAIDVARYWQ